eukprot:gene19729-25657_t
MNCGCGHALGQLKHPIDLTKNHRNMKCRWSCCGQSWNSQFCKVIDEDPFFTGIESKTEQQEFTEAFVSTDEQFLNQEDEFFPQFVDQESSSYELTCGLFTESLEGAWKWMFDAAFSSPVFYSSQYNVSYGDIAQDTELVNEVSLNKYYDIVRQTADIYLSQRGINANYRNVFSRWIDDSSTAWRLIIGFGIQRIYFNDYHRSKEDVVKLLVTELSSGLRFARFSTSNSFLRVTEREVAAENSLLNVITYNELSAHAFINWYVESLINGVRAIVPEDLGLPVYRSQNSSVARILLRNDYLYHSARLSVSSFGYTVDKLIQPSCDFPDLKCGAVVGDSDCYLTFRSLLIEIVMDIGNFAVPVDTINQQSTVFSHQNDPSDLSAFQLPSQDLERNRDLRLSLTYRRNLSSHPFSPHCTVSQRLQIFETITLALNKVCVKFGGQVVRTGSEADLQYREKLESLGLTVDRPANDEVTETTVANSFRDWPQGRGFYFNEDIMVIARINYEDHLELQGVSNSLSESLQQFKILTEILDLVSENLNDTFASDVLFGFHTVNPAHVGSGFVAVANAILVATTNQYDPNSLKSFGNKLGFLYELGSRGAVTISSKYSLGLSSSTIMKLFAEAMTFLLAIDNSLESEDLTSVLMAENAVTMTYTNPQQISIINGNKVSVNRVDVYLSDNKYKVNASDLPILPQTALISQYLTPELFEEISRRLPSSQQRLLLQSIEHLQCKSNVLLEPSIGVLLPSEASVIAFEPLIRPILKQLEDFDLTLDTHTLDADISKLYNVEVLNSPFIKQVRLEVVRNLSGMPFPPAISRSERRAVEALFRASFALLPASVKGTYLQLSSVSDLRRESLSNYDIDVFRCKPSSPSDQIYVSGIGKDWPDARGLFICNPDLITFIINDVNHFTMVGNAPGSRANILINEFFGALEAVSDALAPSGFHFAVSDNLGYITTCLRDIGSALRFSVLLQLPTLVISYEEIESLCSGLGLLLIRYQDGAYLTHKHVLGFSEVQIIQSIINGVAAVMKENKRILSINRNFEDLKEVIDTNVNKIESTNDDNEETKVNTELEINDYSQSLPIIDQSNSVSSDALSQKIAPVREREEESDYSIKFRIEGEGQRKTSRPEMLPADSVDRAMTACGITLNDPFTGEWLQKSFNSSRAQKRFVWIDPLTKTLHWSKVSTKSDNHKCVNLLNVTTVKPSNIPRRTSIFSGNNKAGIVDVWILMTFSNGDTLPGELEKNKKIAWMKAISHFSQANNRI